MTKQTTAANGLGLLAPQQAAIGQKLIEVLGLHVKRNGRVDTTWGDKTPLGLYLTVKRIIDDGGQSKVPSMAHEP